MKFKHVLLGSMIKIPKIPKIPNNEVTPVVAQLLEITACQKEYIQVLKDEIAVLKGEKPKPDIKPSLMDKDKNKGKGNGNNDNKKRAGSTKKNKKAKIKIHKRKKVKAKNIPEGSQFKGYEDFLVQGIVIKAKNILYRRERWLTPDGRTIIADLPKKVKGHFSAKLKSYVLYLYTHGHMTQPLIFEHLRDVGIDLSVGQINNIIVKDKDDFHAEKNEILQAGLEVSDYIHVDDTGARHKGKNGYCTHIGNELFAWFQSTESKSRVNFFELLRAEHKDYQLNEEAFDYMETHQLPKVVLETIKQYDQQSFENKEEWTKALEMLGLTNQRHIRTATEGALLGSILEHGFTAIQSE